MARLSKLTRELRAIMVDADPSLLDTTFPLGTAGRREYLAKRRVITMTPRPVEPNSSGGGKLLQMPRRVRAIDPITFFGGDAA